jgi:hypothetical protein
MLILMDKLFLVLNQFHHLENITYEINKTKEYTVKPPNSEYWTRSEHCEAVVGHFIDDQRPAGQSRAISRRPAM